MSQCMQTPTQNVLEHGYAVHDSYLNLLTNPPECLSKWWDQIKQDIDVYGPYDIETYHIYHDCGKPFCLTIEDGRRHFFNHAEVSYRTWIDHGGTDPVATWILHDMDIHVMPAADVEAYCDLPGAAVLLLTGLAELQANAQMFGGIDSISYKIKFKHWLSRAKAICKRKYNV